MTTPRRIEGEGGVYHIITRGAGRHIIFEDDADRRFFMETLRARADKHGLELLAWCLMGNHVHLLLRGPVGQVSRAMGDVLSIYARHFNRRHERAGALYQGRYKSVPVERDEQLVAAVRYIHLNPVRAGGELAGPWSSYREYVGEPEFADTAFVTGVFGSVGAFEAAHRDGAGAGYGLLPPMRLTEDEAALRAREVLGEVKPGDVGALDRTTRNRLLRGLRDTGLSVRQVVRLTGVGQGIVARV